MRTFWTLSEFTMDDGTKAVAMTEWPADIHDPDVLEGFARRALVNAGGTCPCGGKATMPNRAERRRARRDGKVVRSSARHDPGCPATDENLARRIKAAQQ